MRNYELPQGSGTNEVVVMMKTVKPKKAKKQSLVLRPNSAILFHAPDLEESNILDAVEESTSQTYVAGANAASGGKMGKGGGKSGGWPEGTGAGLIRFIRLEYGGSDWDDGMKDADANFLREFNRVTGFRVAAAGESHPVRLLKKYPKGKAPPFVYMTGSGGIDIRSADVAVLRAYLLEGGMLFADCGSPAWDRSFRRFVTTLFPGESLRVISDDDPIFKAPYPFPNGAPPLWHHGGTKAMGIKQNGRWVVFYHPGDINDAWKTGHSGLSSDLAAGAFQMGINVFYYAVDQYLGKKGAE